MASSFLKFSMAPFDFTLSSCESSCCTPIGRLAPAPPPRFAAALPPPRALVLAQFSGFEQPAWVVRQPPCFLTSLHFCAARPASSARVFGAERGRDDAPLCPLLRTGSLGRPPGGLGVHRLGSVMSSQRLWRRQQVDFSPAHPLDVVVECQLVQ